MVAWDAETPVAGANTAADPVGTGVEGTEVDQLGAGGASEAGGAAAAEAEAGTLGVAAPVVVTGAGGTGVDSLLTRAALISLWAEASGPS